jgi:hypothetical protein
MVIRKIGIQAGQGYLLGRPAKLRTAERVDLDGLTSAPWLTQRTPAFPVAGLTVAPLQAGEQDADGADQAFGSGLQSYVAAGDGTGAAAEEFDEQVDEELDGELEDAFDEDHEDDYDDGLASLRRRTRRSVRAHAAVTEPAQNAP